jgi:basic membrane lipoprotein Med (substrate-binding protein (PBP1-ABC) superfamily)
MKFLEFIYEMYDLHVEINVENVDGDFINDLIDNLSFVYKKRKDKYIRPKTINGVISDDNIDLTIIMHNNDIINIDFKGGILIVMINDDIVYDMDEIVKNNVSKKVYDLYSKYISKQNYKIIGKNNDI